MLSRKITRKIFISEEMYIDGKRLREKSRRGSHSYYFELTRDFHDFHAGPERARGNGAAPQAEKLVV